MASIRTPQSAVSVLLQLARQHSSNIDLHFRALQNIASLSNSNRRKMHCGSQNSIGSLAVARKLGFTRVDSTALSGASLSSCSKTVVATLSMRQSRRNPSFISRVGGEKCVFSKVSNQKRTLSTAANQNRAQNERATYHTLPQVLIFQIFFRF